MTPLQQAALDFCREVMGWDDARLTGGRDWVGYHWQIDPTDPAESGCALFDYADLSAVIPAVRKWCDIAGHTLVITSQRSPKFFRWKVQVSEHGYTLDNDLCLALLAACVAAHRKLKTA